MEVYLAEVNNFVSSVDLLIDLLHSQLDPQLVSNESLDQILNHINNSTDSIQEELWKAIYNYNSVIANHFLTIFVVTMFFVCT